MVYTHTTSHNFDAPWSTVVLAFLNRYPNPCTSHVLSSDIISRTFDPEKRTLRTVRLLLKSGTPPRWAPKGILSENWIIETSEIHCAVPVPSDNDQNDSSSSGIIQKEKDNNNKKYTNIMECKTVNLEHRAVLDAIEWIKVQDSTATTIGMFRSSLLLVHRRIEKYGLKKFINNIANSRVGVALVIHAIQSRPKDFLFARHNDFDFNRLPPHPFLSKDKSGHWENTAQDQDIHNDDYIPSRPSLAQRFSSSKWSPFSRQQQSQQGQNEEMEHNREHEHENDHGQSGPLENKSKSKSSDNSNVTWSSYIWNSCHSISPYKLYKWYYPSNNQTNQDQKSSQQPSRHSLEKQD